MTDTWKRASDIEVGDHLTVPDLGRVGGIDADIRVYQHPFGRRWVRVHGSKGSSLMPAREKCRVRA